MSERKVLQKYYPPDFDPSAIGRSRAPQKPGPKVQTVRLMAPFSMKCTTCGEYIYRGRKFNARKETPADERYLSLQIYRFYIRCTRCSAEITFRTDPKNQDYAVERGAKRNTDPWKRGAGDRDEEETDEQRLDRLEREMAEAAGDDSYSKLERNAMEELEAKTADAKREMAVADALDEIRSRNARIARKVAEEDGDIEGVLANIERGGVSKEEQERLRQEREDEEAARRAFAFVRTQEALEEEIVEEEDDNVTTTTEPNGKLNNGSGGNSSSGTTESSAVAATVAETKKTTTTTTTTDMPPPSFKRQVKKKKDHAALLGIKKKPSLV
ncbi:CWC16 protein [Diplogelasinospora grovesii]|uniref:Splicing factor YJU2 n=1 Tax=Diplogelasinospora grovesii TaxID=303347 RepID=A0AAN6NJJ2_9PEZI|nr:CWC16 protein [Diplogelasinospora grovesii]